MERGWDFWRLWPFIQVKSPKAKGAGLALACSVTGASVLGCSTSGVGIGGAMTGVGIEVACWTREAGLELLGSMTGASGPATTTLLAAGGVASDNASSLDSNPARRAFNSLTSSLSANTSGFVVAVCAWSREGAAENRMTARESRTKILFPRKKDAERVRLDIPTGYLIGSIKKSDGHRSALLGTKKSAERA